MDVGGGGGGDLPGTYTINEGATRALGTNKRSAEERFEAGAQTVKAARIESAGPAVYRLMREINAVEGRGPLGGYAKDTKRPFAISVPYVDEGDRDPESAVSVPYFMTSWGSRPVRPDRDGEIYEGDRRVRRVPSGHAQITTLAVSEPFNPYSGPYTGLHRERMDCSIQ